MGDTRGIAVEIEPLPARVVVQLARADVLHERSRSPALDDQTRALPLQLGLRRCQAIQRNGHIEMMSCMLHDAVKQEIQRPWSDHVNRSARLRLFRAPLAL